MRTAVVAADANGQPLLIKLAARPSSVAPGRIKVAFMVDTTQGLAATDGEKIQRITAPDDLPDEVIVDQEFRIEMN